MNVSSAGSLTESIASRLTYLTGLPHGWYSPQTNKVPRPALTAARSLFEALPADEQDEWFLCPSPDDLIHGERNDLAGASNESLFALYIDAKGLIDLVWIDEYGTEYEQNGLRPDEAAKAVTDAVATVRKQIAAEPVLADA